MSEMVMWWNSLSSVELAIGGIGIGIMLLSMAVAVCVNDRQICRQIKRERLAALQKEEG